MNIKVLGVIAVLAVGVFFWMQHVDKDARPWRLGEPITENSYSAWESANEFDQFTSVVKWYSEELNANPEKEHDYKRLKHIASIIKGCIDTNVMGFETPRETATMCSKKWI
ncbi:hypothetical protein [Kiloniella litopenaei]|uniref:hypothetical protein n=1 Tax=Kiloniella litopenaei TaxID=1549748 RepID=UPI003BA95B4C